MKEYLELFQKVGALMEGHFVLSSGLHSPRYLQCALVLQHPKIAEKLCADLADRVRTLGPTVVLAPALGGIVVSYELARALGTRGIFAERKDGRMTLRRGFEVTSSDRVLIAEDVITTGGSVRELVGLARDAEAQVVGIATLVNRSGDEHLDLGAPLTTLIQLDIPAYESGACPICDKGTLAVKPGSRDPLGGKKPE
ncbi:MAG: orotate phosphoribosyltransferase [Planctomycetia bacterium]|nr:orotate phosphoribosyltransferase [Planctomycetia bacterium]